MIAHQQWRISTDLSESLTIHKSESLDLFQRTSQFTEGEFLGSCPFNFVPAKSNGKKSIDGRILLFSTALVNRFLALPGPRKHTFMG